MLLSITVMCVIAEKKLQLNSASLYVVVIFIIGGILIGGDPGPLAPLPLATPMPLAPLATLLLTSEGNLTVTIIRLTLDWL